MDHSHDHGRIRLLIREGVAEGKNYNVIAKEIAKEFYLFRKSALPRAVVTNDGQGGGSVTFPDGDSPTGSDSMSFAVRFLAQHKAEEQAEREREAELKRKEKDREERAWKLYAKVKGLDESNEFSKTSMIRSGKLYEYTRIVEAMDLLEAGK